ncbi:PREDICTED: conserved oligomeric Golgi complex subunit 6-like [Mesitornis unicolor]|uniref:conserved oligomeric Golgi complex subunit 6-like n=1 Tax=Mesitornis unicolor TaxID=54374 RepID=UPI000528C2AF|nr:PREDICTED: conserved oligomeric Golgi complex subunit 6-like [Mesitornis unicolor]
MSRQGLRAPIGSEIGKRASSYPQFRCGVEMLEALKALSTFFVENSLRTRRNLRGDIERRSLAINEEFVHIFKQVKEELESINEDVQAMSSCCEDMSSRLKAAKEQTQDLIVKTTKLQAEKKLVTGRSSFLEVKTAVKMNGNGNGLQRFLSQIKDPELSRRLCT